METMIYGILIYTTTKANILGTLYGCATVLDLLNQLHHILVA